MLNLTPPIFLSLVTVLVVGFTFHEFAHAWTADFFGDDTPRSQGRLSLNPLVHLDLLGSLLLVTAGFGWARPVQVNPYALQRRSPAAPMLVALAGPASNFILAFTAAIPLRMGLVNPSIPTNNILPTVFQLINIFVTFNILLMMFNLLPIAPLDGEKILTYFLPPEGQDFMARIRPFSSWILIALIFVFDGLLWGILGPPMDLILNLLLG
ncbi:MAG: site-2 protease family protein [Chloroflexi bacterium]|nr:site-2 protease family protein [Chloroflexota bacterium]